MEEFETQLGNGETERIEALPYTLPLNLKKLLIPYKWAIRKKNMSFVIVVDGKSGLGKSTLAFQIGKYCDNDFSLDNVYFNPEDFLKGLANAKPYSVHVLDEAMILSNRSAMSQINKGMVQAMSMIRSKRLIVIFCINSFFDLDRNLALSRADLLLHVYAEGLVGRGRFLAFYKGADNRDRLKELYLLGKKTYSYAKPKANFFTTFPEHFMFNDVEYEAKKQEGVNAFLRGEKKYTAQKAQSSRDRYIRWIRENTQLTVNEIANIGNMGESMIYNILGAKEDD